MTELKTTSEPIFSFIRGLAPEASRDELETSDFDRLSNDLWLSCLSAATVELEWVESTGMTEDLTESRLL